MLSFKQFIRAQINEGGNVQIGDQEAERIDLGKINRDEIIDTIEVVLDSINNKFKAEYGLPIWSGELFASKEFLSGSAFHFFDKLKPTAEFKQYKNTVGDIDTMADKILAKEIEAFLNKHEGAKFGPAKLIGFKKSAGQLITLFQFDNPRINIQVDLEFVDFLNGKPTEWSAFSHSSDWNDIKAGIKGVFQKYALRALSTRTLRDIIILKGKKETPTKVKSTDLAFSVTAGLRVKIEPVMDGDEHRHLDGLPVYREIPTASSTYVTELTSMFSMFFDKEPSKAELTKFGSFIGCVELVKEHFSLADQSKFILGFANTLWGMGAQGLYRGNPELDNKEKLVAFNKMVGILGNKFDHGEIEAMRAVYYKGYKS
jgi:hypothetical protein